MKTTNIILFFTLLSSIIAQVTVTPQERALMISLPIVFVVGFALTTLICGFFIHTICLKFNPKYLKGHDHGHGHH